MNPLDTDLALTPADGLSADALADLWNRAYEGYFVPLHFTPEMLARHIDRAQAALALSRVLWSGGQACGISLAAMRPDGRGYLAGFGIAPAQRRQGLGHRLLAEQLLAWHAAGVRQAQLEVIEANPARRLYAQAGFVEERALLVLQGPLQTASGDPGVRTVDAERLATLHARLHATSPPTWRREMPSVAQALSSPSVQVLALPDERGYAVLADAAEVAGLVDAAAADDDAARRLWAALAARLGGRALRLVDEPEDTPLGRSAQAAGLKTVQRQVEMRVPLPARD